VWVSVFVVVMVAVVGGYQSAQGMVLLQLFAHHVLSTAWLCQQMCFWKPDNFQAMALAASRGKERGEGPEVTRRAQLSVQEAEMLIAVKMPHPCGRPLQTMWAMQRYISSVRAGYTPLP